MVCVTYAVGEGREIYGMANYTPTNAPNMGDICMTTAPKGKLLSCASSETNSLSYTAKHRDILVQSCEILTVYTNSYETGYLYNHLWWQLQSVVNVCECFQLFLSKRESNLV